ncbi:hypothetical protein ACFL0S_08445 [Thermodesulfobacteriota bacterium]
MNREQLPTQLIFQVFTLLIAFIIVHATYVSVVRPKAAAFIAFEHQQIEQDPEEEAVTTTFIDNYERFATQPVLGLEPGRFQQLSVIMEQRHRKVCSRLDEQVALGIIDVSGLLIAVGELDVISRS